MAINLLVELNNKPHLNLQQKVSILYITWRFLNLFYAIIGLGIYGS